MDQLLLFVSTHKSILSVSPCVREVRSERSDSCVVSKQELAAVLKNLKPKMQLAHKKSMHCLNHYTVKHPFFVILETCLPQVVFHVVSSEVFAGVNPVLLKQEKQKNIHMKKLKQ